MTMPRDWPSEKGRSEGAVDRVGDMFTCKTRLQRCTSREFTPRRNAECSWGAFPNGRFGVESRNIDTEWQNRPLSQTIMVIVRKRLKRKELGGREVPKV